jgi:uncharacterized protein DUF4410
MKKLQYVLTALVMVMLTACSGNVKNLSVDSNYKYAGEQYGAVNVDTSKATISDDGSFDKIALKQKIQEILEKENLIKSTSAETIRINIKNVRLRSEGAAVLLGFLAGADSLEGTVTLLGKDGQVVNQFDIDASYAAGGFIGGQDGMRMEWLYGKFGELTAQTIKG